MGILIEDLPAVASASSDHVIPAMRTGETFKVSVEQLATFIVALVTDSAPETLDTLNELAAALGDDPNFAATTANALANRIRADAVQAFDSAQKLQAASNIDTVSYGSAQSLTASQRAQGRANIHAPLKGHINGLTISNHAGDLTNDIGVSDGEAASTSATPFLINLSSSLIKRLDASWAIGANQGMRWSGEAIGNKTYHVFLGVKSDGSDADIFAYPGTSGTDADTVAFAATVLAAWQAETGGSQYAHVRRIGSILRESGALVSFVQNGDDFTRVLKVDNNATPNAAASLTTVSVPVGLLVQPKFNIRLLANQSTTARTLLGSAFSAAADLPVVQDVRTVAGAIASDNTQINSGFFTDTSARVMFGRDVQAGSIASFSLITCGWIDTRGRL
jgi:hypothetical protein